jgi:hypothetical protein
LWISSAKSRMLIMLNVIKHFATAFLMRVSRKGDVNILGKRVSIVKIMGKGHSL